MVQGETGIQGVSHGLSKSMVAASLLPSLLMSLVRMLPPNPTHPIVFGAEVLGVISMCSCPPDPGLSYLFVGLLFLYQVP